MPRGPIIHRVAATDLADGSLVDEMNLLAVDTTITAGAGASTLCTVTFNLAGSHEIEMLGAVAAAIGPNTLFNLIINVDTVDKRGAYEFNTAAATTSYGSVVVLYKQTLAAGAHTVLLKGISTVANAAVISALTSPTTNFASLLVRQMN